MLSTIWNTLLYKPFLNALLLLVFIIPGGDLGLAVILLTVFVKLLISPLSANAIKNQAKMNLMSPELEAIKKSGVSKEEQARQTFEVYKKHKTNPFSGCLMLIIQIPIIFALYFVFYKGINLDPSMLYSFVPRPEQLNMNFLGIIDLGSKSLILAVLAGASQYFQARFMPKPVQKEGGEKSFADMMAKNMHVQMKYVFPFIVAFIAYSISGAVALYWLTSNVFAILQQLYLKRKGVITLN